MQPNDINALKSLISICYDKAHNTTLIRRCFSAIYFEIILFIALNSPNLRDEIFSNQNGTFNGIKEGKIVSILKDKVLANAVSSGKINGEEANNFLNYIRLIERLRTLVDHFGGFKDELLKMGIYKIRIKGKDLSVQQLDVERLSREILVNLLKETEILMTILNRLFSSSTHI
ncbi:MAG: hypothetical protein RXR07_11570 [Sulfolobaceae archaeon]